MLKKGFTLIELLIVIAVLGILATAVLSAINPLEQLKKARDAGRKSDAAELLNAHERYVTTFGCYSWENADSACGGANNNPSKANAVASTFSGSGLTGFNADLITKQELKTQFQTRSTVTKGELFLSESTASDTLGQISVCFTPESQSFREGGGGPIMNQDNSATGSCSGAYAVSSATCNVCIPQ